MRAFVRIIEYSLMVAGIMVTGVLLKDIIKRPELFIPLMIGIPIFVGAWLSFFFGLVSKQIMESFEDVNFSFQLYNNEESEEYEEGE